jgi:predicted transposase/invertase (TIGR01784 family)
MFAAAPSQCPLKPATIHSQGSDSHTPASSVKVEEPRPRHIGVWQEGCVDARLFSPCFPEKSSCEPCDPQNRHRLCLFHGISGQFLWNQDLCNWIIQVMNRFHPTNPHDQFFRRTFEVVHYTRALLKAKLPEDLLAGLRLESLAPTKETFLAASEQEKRLDLLYSARFLDGTEVLIYLLLEHKSYIDRHIALQLLEYVLKIQGWRRRNKQPPCVVIPVVVYHGDKPWDEPTSFRDKIRPGQRLSPFVPDMQAIVVDFSLQSSAAFPEIPELEARIRTLRLVRRAKLQFDSVVAIFRLLQFWQEIDSHRDALNDIILYLCHVFDAQRLKWFEQAVRTGLQIDSETQMPTCFEALVERGMKKGLEKGLEKGREQGREQGLLMGRIRTLQEVLQQPVSSQETLAALPREQLQSLASQLQELLAATRPSA